MDNMTNTNFKRKLPVPQEIKKEMPLSKEAEEIKTKRDRSPSRGLGDVYKRQPLLS